MSIVFSNRSYVVWPLKGLYNYACYSIRRLIGESINKNDPRDVIEWMPNLTYISIEGLGVLFAVLLFRASKTVVLYFRSPFVPIRKSITETMDR